ncbi:MAG: penicillin-binding protein activator [Dokdonella sp.]
MPASLRCFRSIRHSICLLLLMGVLASSGCVSVPSTPPRDSADAAQADQLLREGELAQAADAFLELAIRSGNSDEAAYFRLRAAETLREDGNLEAAARAIEPIKRRRLHDDQPLRLDLLDAEIALSRNDVQRASALLMFSTAELPPSLRVRALELRARVEVANGDRFAAARTRAQLDHSLSGADREANRADIVATLGALDSAELKRQAGTLAPNDALLPWVEQALRKHGEMLPRVLPRGERQVGTLLPGSGDSLQREGFSSVHQIALLLPMGGQTNAVSQAISDGFLAAYYNDDVAQRPELRIYDSGRTPADALASYQRAVADGAGFVVGPLQREAVGELFRNPLPVRVLALNHPDTGEAAPPGSAEFGLLPEAEGAQAAARMLSLGIQRATMFAAETDWSTRATTAFRTQFESMGGSVSGESRLRENEVNYQANILQATQNLGDSSRADIGVFISMRPQQARMLLPQLRLAGVQAPVFATSHVNSGEVSPGMDRDLDGVEFCDAPWLFMPVAGLPDRNSMARQLDSASGLGGRLFAFGMDAYSLLPYMDWLLEHPDSYLDGASGQLSADSFGRIHRNLSWARFGAGVARPVQGALSAMPAQ